MCSKGNTDLEDPCPAPATSVAIWHQVATRDCTAAAAVPGLRSYVAVATSSTVQLNAPKKGLVQLLNHVQVLQSERQLHRQRVNHDRAITVQCP